MMPDRLMAERKAMLNARQETMTVDAIKELVTDYVLREFLPGTTRAELTESTPLITGGILDSLGTLNLIMFLEERFQIEFQTDELDRDRLNTISAIAALVHSKMA